MNQRDWQNIFGDAPEDFHRQLCAALDGLEEKEMKKRYKISTVLIAAAITVLLLTGAALAASQLGIFKFFMNTAEPILPLEGVEEMVITGLGSTENELVTMTLEEALYTGQGALVQIRYTAKDPEHYALLSDGLDFETDEEYDIRRTEYSEVVVGRWDGKTDIMCGKNITLTDDEGGEIWLDRWDGEMQEDGSIVIWGSGFSAKPLSENVTLNVNASTVVCGEWDEAKGSKDYTRVEIEPLIVPMVKTEPERQVRYEPVDGGAGERFEVLSVEVSFTKLCAYLGVDYRYQQAEEGEEMGIDFRVYDADGNRITTGGGECNKDGDIEHWLMEMQSFEEAPQSLWFEAKVIGEDRTLGRVECKLVEE